MSSEAVVIAQSERALKDQADSAARAAIRLLVIQRLLSSSATGWEDLHTLLCACTPYAAEATPNPRADMTIKCSYEPDGQSRLQSGFEYPGTRHRNKYLFKPMCSVFYSVEDVLSGPVRFSFVSNPRANTACAAFRIATGSRDVSFQKVPHLRLA